MRRHGLLLAALVLLGGCMGRWPVPGVLDRPAPEAAAPSAPTKPILYYVGVALYDESWSEGDAAGLAEVLRAHASGFEVRPLVFSNGGGGTFPAATKQAVEAALGQIGRAARPEDVTLLFVSTHGAPRLLGVHAGGREFAPLTDREMAAWLAPLDGRPTVVILSACYAGSFIPALQAPNRILLTAARADRTSFGCRAGAAHTVFGEALLAALGRPDTSLRQTVGTVRDTVARQERQLAVSPSLPQVAVGAQAAALFDAPAF